MRKIMTAAVGFLLVFGLVAFADDYNRKTVITLGEPLIVSGVPQVTLAPGKYVIRLVNHDHSRNIVQIFNEREDHLYTTVLAINNYRLEPKGETTFRFWETPSGNPPALRAWFFPGDNYGQEFVYPKGLAASIARATGEPVLSTPAETVAELEAAPVTRVKETGEEQPVEEAFVAPEPAVVEEAFVAPEPAAEEAAPLIAQAEPAPEPYTEELPATASPFFLIGLAGLASAAAGFGLRYAMAHRS